MNPYAAALLLLAWLCSGVTPCASAAAPGTSATVEGGSVGWLTPVPPYPATALRNREQGTLYLTITTDKAGAITKVVASVPLRQKQDMSNLGVWAVRWVLARWHGPPSVTKKVEFVYRLR